MTPFSYSVCASRIVRWAPKPRRLEPACWSVLVMNGAGGLLVVRFFSMPRTGNGGAAARGGLVREAGGGEGRARADAAVELREVLRGALGLGVGGRVVAVEDEA